MLAVRLLTSGSSWWIPSRFAEWFVNCWTLSCLHLVNQLDAQIIRWFSWKVRFLKKTKMIDVKSWFFDVLTVARNFDHFLRWMSWTKIGEKGPVIYCVDGSISLGPGGPALRVGRVAVMSGPLRRHTTQPRPHSQPEKPSTRTRCPPNGKTRSIRALLWISPKDISLFTGQVPSKSSRLFHLSLFHDFNGNNVNS